MKQSISIAKKASQARMCFVVVYLGKWPKWIHLFFRSCSYNPEVHWRIFTNCDLDVEIPDNVFLHRFSREDVEALIQSKIGADYKFSYGYKLCDMKPAYGDYFADYLADYEFWGYTDLDIVLGRIRDFVSQELLDHFDVITGGTRLVVGHFTLIRNTPRLNQLYRECAGYLPKFYSLEYEKFDEFEFSDYVKGLGERGDICFYERRIQAEDSYIFGSGRSHFLIWSHHGKMRDLFDFRAICYFHFIHSKYRDDFSYSDSMGRSDVLCIDRQGIYELATVNDYVRFLKGFVRSLISAIPYLMRRLAKAIIPATLLSRLRSV